MARSNGIMFIERSCVYFDVFISKGFFSHGFYLFKNYFHNYIEILIIFSSQPCLLGL